MAPYAALIKSSLEESQAQPHLLKRDLTVNHTQAVTLGVMGAYVVIIALLWNLPYVRWVLWPFKVHLPPEYHLYCLLMSNDRCW
jgi:hypothetical protein